MKLRRFLLQRVALFVVGLFFVISLTFVITRVLPGNPAYYLAGQFAGPQQVEAVEDKLGLDESIPAQYVDYLEELGHGELGESIRTHESVASDLGARWPATLELGLIAGLLAMAWAIPVGAIAALRRGSKVDRAAGGISAIGVSMPEFWLGMILILVFFSELHIAPAPIGRITGAPPEHITGFYTVDSLLSGNLDAFGRTLSQLALPAITLAVIAGAPIMRVTRAFMIEVLDSDYIRAARALGVPQRRLLVRHALPNIIVPVSAMLVFIFGWVLGGTVLVEYVFAWPGIGKYAVESISDADYAPVMGVLLISATTYLLLYLVTDLLHLLIDPRTRT